MNMRRFSIKSTRLVIKSICAQTCNIRPTFGIKGFEFASMQNLKYSKAVDSVKPGLHLRGYCKNESCSHNDDFVCNFGFGMFDAEYLNISCKCPVCCLQFNPIGIGFYKANIYVDGINQSGTKMLYKDKIFNCVYEPNDNTLWVKLEISVSELR